MDRTRDLASLAGEETIFGGFAAEKLKRLQAANPPYMGSSNMNGWLSGWTKKRYKEVCKDLCTCFIKRGFSLSDDRGYEALITSDTCMYISSFEKMRKAVIERTSIVCFIDTRGTNAHPDVFDANAGWVLWNHPGADIKGSYFKLNHPISEKGQRLLEALANPDCGWFYRIDASGFKAIPGSPIAYWASKQLVASFIGHSSLKEVANPVEGIKTGDNDRHLRLWFEVSRSKEHLNSSDSPICLWRKMCKGGEFRKWYGNNEYVCHWGANGAELFNDPKSCISNKDLLFKPAFNWTYISSGRFAARRSDNDSLYNNKGPACYSSEEQVNTLLGAMNSSYAQIVLDITSPTLDYKPGGVGCTPVPARPVANVNKLVLDCIAKTKVDWDVYETSWDFRRHPLT